MSAFVHHLCLQNNFFFLSSKQSTTQFPINRTISTYNDTATAYYYLMSKAQMALKEEHSKHLDGLVFTRSWTERELLKGDTTVERVMDGVTELLKCSSSTDVSQ